MLDVKALRALIVDVDGTLYMQRPVRTAVAWRLLKAYATRPREGTSTLRALRAYRRAQEALREPRSPISGDLAAAQVRLASQMTGEDGAFVGACLARWMHQEPLDLVARARREALCEFLQAVKHHQLSLGVFSDYPAMSKLEALGVARCFDVVVTAQDPELQKFKPSPRGLEVTLQRLGVTPAQALYVGDRPDTDGLAAKWAGVSCVIIGRRHRTPTAGDAWLALSGYKALSNAFGWN